MSHKETFRSGRMATVYGVQRDPSLNDRNIIRDKKEVKFPFVAGNSYKGDWLDNCKHGFGVEIAVDGNKYEGEWERDKKHGKGTMWKKKGKTFKKQYEGGWEEDLMYGYGIFYYENGDVYKGNWVDSKRNGQGRLEYANGDVYDGEFKDNKRNGMGTLFLANGNVYEGHWIGDLKEGPGKFLYASTRKLYEGEWAKDIPQCGEYRQPTEEESMLFMEPGVWKASYELPGLELDNPRAVLDKSTAKMRAERSQHRGLSSITIDSTVVDGAAEIFYAFARAAQRDHECSLIEFKDAGEVFSALGLDINDEIILQETAMRLDLDMQTLISFPEIVDLANFMVG